MQINFTVQYHNKECSAELIKEWAEKFDQAGLDVSILFTKTGADIHSTNCPGRKLERPEKIEEPPRKGLAASIPL